MSHFTQQLPPSYTTTTGHGPSAHSHSQPHNRRSIGSIASLPPNYTNQRALRMQPDRNGAMPMPVGNAQQRQFGGNGGNMRESARGPASPPKNKNTQHVPCKFFLQGQCQAGSMCPFSHDVESTTRPAPCKYFAKGGCKFGRKCALLHITPDGQVVNRPYPPPSQQYMSSTQPAFAQPPPPGLLSMQAQGLEQRPNGDQYDEFQYPSQQQQDNQPQIDMTYTSASPKFGSPTLNGLGASPPYKGRSVLDAPLPNSFDSNGISWAARNGPFAASVPSKFDSPPSSLPRQTPHGNSALRDLHSSAFGDRGMDTLLLGMSTSPSTSNPADDAPMSFEKRPLHSSRFRIAQPRQLLSASLGARYTSNPLLTPTSTPFSHNYNTYSEDDEDDAASDYDPADADREEDLLPSSLHDLIPEGPRSRRESRTNNSNGATSSPIPPSFLSSARRAFSNGQANSTSSPLPSPGMSSSPSRYSGVFARTAGSTLNGLGHVGSPLRDSTFPTDGWPSAAAGGLASPLGTPIADSPGFIDGLGSPPLNGRGSAKMGMSMLTQGLRATKLSANGSSSSAGAVGSRSSRIPIDRNPSTASVGPAPSEKKIEEEKEEIFDMDFEGGGGASADSGRDGKGGEGRKSKTNGRSGGGVESGTGGAFGPIGGGRTTK